MNKFNKAIAAIMLIGLVLHFLGCNRQTQRGIINGHAYVDLGLPSGTLWATCNIGSIKPEDYGDYYAWGELMTKKCYKAETYSLFDDNEEPIRYTYQDSLLTLIDVDDVAANCWGKGWRIPTIIDWEEMVSHCSYSWVENNGVKGVRFMADNGNYIFLPCSGVFDGKEHDSHSERGCYWSSSLYDTQIRAWVFCFDAEERSLSRGSLYRSIGLPIRPVCNN